MGGVGRGDEGMEMKQSMYKILKNVRLKKLATSQSPKKLFIIFQGIN